MKFGAWTPCRSCGAMPRSEQEWNLSAALTDHFHNLETLERLSRKIKQGIEIRFMTKKGKPWPDLFADDRNSQKARAKKTEPRKRGSVKRQPK